MTRSRGRCGREDRRADAASSENVEFEGQRQVSPRNSAARSETTFGNYRRQRNGGLGLADVDDPRVGGLQVIEASNRRTAGEAKTAEHHAGTEESALIAVATIRGAQQQPGEESSAEA